MKFDYSVFAAALLLGTALTAPVLADDPAKPAEKATAKLEQSKVVTLPDGLQYEDLKMGEGPEVTTGQTVQMRYTGKLVDGKVFDSNVGKAPYPVTLGSSNVIKGRVLDDSHLSSAGSTLRCSGGKFAAGGEGAAAIRQHSVRLSAKKPDAAENVLPGIVVRQVFLGSSRDYLVEVGDGTQLRVVAPAGENIPQGASVWLHLPPERCRVLSG